MENVSANAVMTVEEEVTPAVPTWTLVTSHGLVLLYLAAYPSSTMRTVSKALGITERRVVDIIKDLQKSDLLTVLQIQRRNHYTVNPDAHFRHPIVAGISFDDFLNLWKAARKPDADGADDGAATLERV